MKQPFNLIFSISFSKTDVAISAPYGGKDRGGVVFIYIGTKDGIESSFRQVNYFNGVLPQVIKKTVPNVASILLNYYFHSTQAIEASDISVGVKTFGFSLAGNVDVDNNGYPGQSDRVNLPI